MGKKLTAKKARKILHDKSVHGHPLTEQQRKFFGAIAGGAKPYKAEEGGWLDKYEQGGMVLNQKKNDNYGKKANPNDVDVSFPPGFKGWAYNTKGRNYSPAWGGQFQDGGYVDSVLNANKKLDWVQRLYEKNTPSIQIKGQKGRSTHFMESADNRVYPTVVRENGKLKYIGNKAYDYADSTRTYIEFPSEKEATWFAENYKKGTNVLKKENGGNLMPAMAGANQTVPMAQLGDSVKPIPMQLAMGGSLPGSVGFMYARTQSPAPSNGPYAKKTKASAQNGKEMKYYQEGLDFKPKTISQDGSEIPVDPDGYWNPDNWGSPVIIPSTDITMEDVLEPLIGVSNTGDVQYMEPGEDYEFDGDYVTEYPVAKKGISVNNADAQPVKKLDQLLNFTNYNKPTKGGWLDKYQ